MNALGMRSKSLASTRRINLDFADPQRLMESIIGPTVFERFRTVLKYVQIARQHMPSKKEKETIEERPRAGGTDIRFPTPAAPMVILMIRNARGLTAVVAPTVASTYCFTVAAAADVLNMFRAATSAAPPSCPAPP